MTLITICDVPATIHQKDRLEQSGGKIARIWNGLMDVQFKDCLLTVNKVGTIKIESDSKVILFFKEEHGSFYVQYIDD